VSAAATTSESVQRAARPAFLITIDTEGDNIWARPGTTTTENALFLPRFQALCEQHGLKPTYLANFEMACDVRFVKFAKAAVASDAAEVGAHLHAWNSPPIRALTADDNRFHPYLTEFPADVMAEKLSFITHLLEERLEHKMMSHRGGRWALDETYARLLVDHGYLVDCSVTPHVSWARSGTQPAGIAGPDFRNFPERPYWIDPADISRPGRSRLLEAPMTIRWAQRPLTRILRPIPGLGGYLYRRRPELRWLRPNGTNLDDMLCLCDEVVMERAPYAMFMLHSSEFMPGGSPAFPTTGSIERLYEHLQTLFARVRDKFTGTTLTQFQKSFTNTRDSMPIKPGAV